MTGVREGDEVQLVVFRIGPQHFAFNVFQAERILRYEKPTPLPKATTFLEGMLAYGEGSIPILDLRKRLGAAAPVMDETRTVVLELEQGKIGVVVDAVLEVRKVPADAITLPPELVRGLAAEYIHGIISHGDQSVVILAAARLLSSTEQVALEELIVETAQ